MSGIPEVDWRQFDLWPVAEVECRDGTVYRSHAKLVKVGEDLVVLTELACPECGKTHGHVRRVSHEPEVMELRR